MIPHPPSLMSPTTTNSGTIQPAMPPAGTGVVPISAAFPAIGQPAGMPLPPVQLLPGQFPPAAVARAQRENVESRLSYTAGMRRLVGRIRTLLASEPTLDLT